MVKIRDWLKNKDVCKRCGKRRRVNNDGLCLWCWDIETPW